MLKSLFSKKKAETPVVHENDQDNKAYSDIQDPEFWRIFNLCKPYTMTSVERMYSLYNSVNHVLNFNIAGDFVECGVWRGGSAMMIAAILKSRNITNKKLYLFDTFEGMSEPTNNDLSIDGSKASDLLEEQLADKANSVVWCLASLEDVQANMTLTEYDTTNIIYVKGKVEDTIPHQIPNSPIALLRLDTDWYESTRHELIHLYPLLVTNGILIIDDYGHWQGCKKAVDEYFTQHKISILLNRIDYTGRIAVKTI